MSWYFQHQRAKDIIAERQREAKRIQLARMFDDEQRAAPWPEPSRSPIRRAVGRGVLAVGGAVTRAGRALHGAEPNPTV